MSGSAFQQPAGAAGVTGATGVQGSTGVTGATGVAASLGYAKLQDQQVSGTVGGTPVALTQNVRVLNTVVTDDAGIVSLNANRFTLQAGTYRIAASAPAYVTPRHKLRLQNVTDATTTIVGTSEHAVGSGDEPQTRSFVWGQFTIASAKVFEIQHYFTGAGGGTRGLGIETSDGDIEVYAVVELWKIA